MKISIWQQFSSNHSNGFTVVGKFATEADAIKAAAKWNDILEAIYAPWGDYPTTEPLQAEINLGREYGFEWTEHLEWIRCYDTQHVHQFGSYVSVASIFEIYDGAKYIAPIMAKLSDESYVREAMGVSCLLVNFRFRMPDERKITKLYHILGDYLNEARSEDDPEPPWRAFAKSADDYSPNDSAYYGYIHHKGQQFWFSHLTFGEIGVGLPAMIAYLQSEGCTDIEYSIEERNCRMIYEEGDQ